MAVDERRQRDFEHTSGGEIDGRKLGNFSLEGKNSGSSPNAQAVDLAENARWYIDYVSRCYHIGGRMLLLWRVRKWTTMIDARIGLPLNKRGDGRPSERC
jgi:hypothetical protein